MQLLFRFCCLHRRLHIQTVILAVVGWSSICQSATLYVGPDGEDASSGTLPTPNATKTNGCFATMNRARNEIRKIKKTQGLPKEGITVVIRVGDI